MSLKKDIAGNEAELCSNWRRFQTFRTVLLVSKRSTFVLFFSPPPPLPPFPHAFSDSPSSSGDVGEAIVSDSSVTAGVGIIFS